MPADLPLSTLIAPWCPSSKRWIHDPAVLQLAQQASARDRAGLWAAVDVELERQQGVPAAGPEVAEAPQFTEDPLFRALLTECGPGTTRPRRAVR